MQDLEKTYTEADIKLLIETKAEESTYLEFKAAGSLKNVDKSLLKDVDSIKIKDFKVELSKDVSAFANADGGVIIYGVDEKNQRASAFSFIDGNVMKVETIQQIIDSNIHQKIEGLIIDAIRVEGKIEQSVYVVKIPRSNNTPHQAATMKFHKRRGKTTDEMEEYEIRESYNRKAQTELKIVEPEVTHGNVRPAGMEMQCSVEIHFNVENISKAIEDKYKLEILIPSELFGDSELIYAISFHQKAYVRKENFYLYYSIANTSPLFQGEKFYAGKIRFTLDRAKANIAFNNNICMKLYFSGGIAYFDFKVSDYLISLGKKIELDDFIYRR